MSKRGKVIISREPLHQQVAEQLRQMIIAGELAPAEKIQFGDLAKSLGVSLTPLREAVKVLATEHLVDLSPNRGARVALLTVAETESLFEVMSELEALGAKLACQRMTDDQLQEIEELHSMMRGHFQRSEKDEYFACNREIHDKIVEFAKNPILVSSRKHLSVRAERVRHFSVARGTRRDEAMQDHEDLMIALRARDTDAAHSVWQRHLVRSGRETCEVLRDFEKQTNTRREMV
ncbi:MAG: GntR family transcriptional regulator [Rhizobiaceae bacterium]